MLDNRFLAFLNLLPCNQTPSSTEELIGTNGFEILHPDDKKQFFPFLKQIISGAFKLGDIKRIEIRLRKKSGEYFVAESIAKLIKDESGKTQILSVARDISGQKLTEEKPGINKIIRPIVTLKIQHIISRRMFTR